jgi:hypothetical protein
MNDKNKSQDEDIDLLSGLLAKGLSGGLNIGMGEAMKIFGAAKRVGVNQEVTVRALRRFCMEDPRAVDMLEMACSNETLAKLVDRFNLRAKEAKKDG